MTPTNIARVSKDLLEVADTVPLAPMSPMRQKKVRAFERETVDMLTTNSRTELGCHHIFLVCPARNDP